ncbi:helix-turn-helix transcriptional regulator [Cronobacter dublinensis]|uniref:helix-turn-helix transcriptional regulator n=1 Tax=Cronobacter dublinensis TaxID=413497 RepID=UPI001375B84A|nr:hypothetical protein [Cronobacter dublinensis]NCH97997.1 hypothetical protein [Cronobacter dublinensis]
MPLKLHPGYILAIKMAEKEITPIDFCGLTGLPEDTVSGLLVGSICITPYLAEKISLCFENEFFWIKAQAEFCLFTSICKINETCQHVIPKG